jgi:hypothetical protein
MAGSTSRKSAIKKQMDHLSEEQGREISILWDLTQARNELDRKDFSQALMHYQSALSSVFSLAKYIDNDKLEALLFEIKRVLRKICSNGTHIIIGIPKSMFEETFKTANKYVMKDDLEMSAGVDLHNIKIFEEVMELVRRFPTDSMRKKKRTKPKGAGASEGAE